MKPIRVRASGVVIRDGAILLIAYDGDGAGYHFNVPGGGVEIGESMRDTVRREFMEEACFDVSVGPLLLTWEAIEASFPAIRSHTIGHVFFCETAPDAEPRMPEVLDNKHQVGLEWVPLTDLPDAPLMPKIGRQIVDRLGDASRGDWFFYDVDI